MLSPKQMELILADRNLKSVANAANVSYRLVRWIANGKAEAAQLDALERLSDYLEGKIGGTNEAN